jgi:hypothetical protein
LLSSSMAVQTNAVCGLLLFKDFITMSYIYLSHKNKYNNNNNNNLLP